MSCEKEPKQAMSANNAWNVIKAIQKHAIGCRLILASTDLVYDGLRPPFNPLVLECGSALNQ
jgi:dTDP-4-dehydrorhamnose reductase